MAQMKRGIHIPLQPHWADYLWLHGRLNDLITPLNQNCISVTGWRIEVGRPWEEIVCEGVQAGDLKFAKGETSSANNPE